MNKQQIINRIEYLMELGNKTLLTRRSSEWKGEYVSSGEQMGFRAASLSFIKNIYTESHPYYSDFNERVKGVSPKETENGINILQVIKNEFENDWYISIKNIVSAEIFSDFMEMSKYLLDQNFKDASAVMIGSVLEEHLRFLCKNNAIETTIEKGENLIPKKAERMNSDLTQENIYGILEQKNITAWLDLRNKAAHGKYEEYKREHVELMYLGVLNFIITYK